MANQYYQNQKERLLKEACERYQKTFWRKIQEAKKGSRQVSKSSWRTKAETTSVYKKKLFNT